MESSESKMGRTARIVKKKADQVKSNWQRYPEYNKKRK